MDKERISKDNYVVREDRKKLRKLKEKFQVVQHDVFHKSESMHYQPQGFHGRSTELEKSVIETLYASSQISPTIFLRAKCPLYPSTHSG